MHTLLELQRLLPATAGVAAPALINAGAPTIIAALSRFIAIPFPADRTIPRHRHRRTHLRLGHGFTRERATWRPSRESGHAHHENLPEISQPNDQPTTHPCESSRLEALAEQYEYAGIAAGVPGMVHNGLGA